MRMPMRFALERLAENDKTVVDENEHQRHGHARGGLATVRANAKWNGDERETDRGK